MAVFASTASVSGRPLTELIGSDELPQAAWEEIKAHVRQGGKKIIQLRGRSSFQSPSHVSILMVKAVMEGGGFGWPSGVYLGAAEHGFDHIMMAMETKLTEEGVSWALPKGTEEEMAALKESYQHLCKLRDEVIEMGILPATDRWSELNPNL
jgi:malate dehydrogenase